MAHQEAIAWIKRVCGIKGPWSAIKVRHDGLASTIHDIEQETAIAALGGEWLQHGEKPIFPAASRGASSMSVMAALQG
jgi:hypothetical protein